jgi:HAD superfamily hydrolase (TIGR01549 family)
MKNTVLFDLDGTLVEHGHALFPPLLAKWGYDRSVEEVKDAVAEEIHHFYNHIAAAEEQGWVPDLYRQFYQRVIRRLGVSDPDGERAEAMFAYFDTHPTPPLYADVPPVVKKLYQDGWRLGVITQRGHAGAESFLTDHGLAEFFPVIVAGDDGHGRKPGPGPFQAALEMLGAAPEEAVYVGDRIDDDCEGAVNAGLDAFLIDRDGVWEVASLDRDDFIRLARMGELLDHLPNGPQTERK